MYRFLVANRWFACSTRNSFDRFCMTDPLQKAFCIISLHIFQYFLFSFYFSTGKHWNRAFLDKSDMQAVWQYCDIFKVLCNKFSYKSCPKTAVITFWATFMPTSSQTVIVQLFYSNAPWKSRYILNQWINSYKSNKIKASM